MNNKKLHQEQIDNLLKILKERFEKNKNRHIGIKWEKVHSKIINNDEVLWSLYQMEETGGEPDVIVFNSNSNEIIFVDCSTESPKGRRSLCYDGEAMESRKENKPKNNAIDMAKFMGIEILDEYQYRELQKYGEFDIKTSSWIKTPEKIRKLGGALFCDRRYDTVFTYHNSAESYYSSRGFRGMIRVID